MPVTTIVILCEDVTVGVVVLVLIDVAVDVAQTVVVAVGDGEVENVERTVVVGEAIFDTVEFDDAEDVAESDAEVVDVMVVTRVAVVRGETVPEIGLDAVADEELVLDTEAVEGADAVIVIGEDNETDGKAERVKSAEGVRDTDTVSELKDEPEPILDRVEDAVSLEVRDARGVTDVILDIDINAVAVTISVPVPLAEMETIPVRDTKVEGEAVGVDDEEMVALVQALDEAEPDDTADDDTVVVDVVVGERENFPETVPTVLTLDVDEGDAVIVNRGAAELVVDDVATADNELVVDGEGDIDEIAVAVVDLDVTSVCDVVLLAVDVPDNDGVPVSEMVTVLGAVITAVREI